MDPSNVLMVTSAGPLTAKLLSSLPTYWAASSSIEQAVLAAIDSANNAGAAGRSNLMRGLLACIPPVRRSLPQPGSLRPGNAANKCRNGPQVTVENCQISPQAYVQTTPVCQPELGGR